MQVFIAGAGGSVGRQLVPQLVERGHEVVASTRSSDKQDEIRQLGAEAVVMDGLDAGSVAEAIAHAQPEVVVHQMTALGRGVDLRRFDRSFALTNRLRTEGTDHLLAAAAASGARRAVLNAGPLEGLVLRYGSFYGPGTSVADEFARLIRARKFPVVGGGRGVWSFIHIADAAAATVAAIEGGAPGIYDIVDDDPAPVAEWLPYLAARLGAKPPRRIPRLLAWPMLGEVGISMMTRISGSSNAKARRELGFVPRYASWRDGFRQAT